MKTIKDKTDKLFKPMITPKSAALCIRVLNHQSNLFRLLSFIYNMMHDSSVFYRGYE